MALHGVALIETNPAELGYLAGLLRAAWNDRHTSTTEARWLATAEVAVQFFAAPPPALTDEHRLEADVESVISYAIHNQPELLVNRLGRKLLILANHVRREHRHQYWATR